MKNIQKGKNAASLMYRRLLSYYMQKNVSKKDFEQGVAFKINSLTSKTFIRHMAKESNVSKTQAKGDGQILEESTSAPQTSVAEPTTPGDQSTTTTTMKPTPAKPIKKTIVKSKKPTKSTKMGPLEDEIPEVNPVTTQMSLETIAATSSQHVERS
ncbi:hypothetical protein Hanom_Chr06g00537021 [Helianthus anomalus]